jgi:hypothetical protein
MKEPATKISAFALAGIIVLAPATLELACSGVEANESYASVGCEKPTACFRAPYRGACGSLVERSFPPHSREDHSDHDVPSTTASISTSGNSTNTTVRAISVSLPSEFFSA